MKALKATRNPRAVAMLTLAATVMGLLYYSQEVGRFLTTTMSKDSESMQYFHLDPAVLDAMPWTNKPWSAVGPGKETLLYHANHDFPVVSVDGLVVGRVDLQLMEISADGRTYRGPAICAEHGGVVSWNALLHRQSNNRLRLEIESISPTSPKVDLEFEPSSSISR